VKSTKTIVNKIAETAARIIGVDNHFQTKQFTTLETPCKIFSQKEARDPENIFFSPHTIKAKHTFPTAGTLWTSKVPV